MNILAKSQKVDDTTFMGRAITLARRSLGGTSPNPIVGAVLVRARKIIGEGWHRGAGLPHAEVEAIQNCVSRGNKPRGAILYVTLEPCSTQGRTPACTKAILHAGIKTVVVGAIDPNPKHAGRGLDLLIAAGVQVRRSSLEAKATALNPAFNHWIVTGRPLVTVKAAMSLDGKIATSTGESKWITGEKARLEGMNLRRKTDAILVGVNTLVADDPSLTFRAKDPVTQQRLRRFVLDPTARIPIQSKVIVDDPHGLTTIVVNQSAAANRVRALQNKVNVWVCPTKTKLDLDWVLAEMGRNNITALLVEGGGETNAEFLLNGYAQRIVFFYAPLIIGGREAKKSVAGLGIQRIKDAIPLTDLRMRWLGVDLMLSARVETR